MLLSDKEFQSVKTYLDKHFGKKVPTPEEVLEIAKDEKSAIHSYFEWDDKKAAKQYRLFQARSLIKIVLIEDSPREIPSYEYLKIESGNNLGSYFSNNEESHSFEDLMIPSALSELKSFKERYKNHIKLVPVIDAINQLLKEYEHGEEETKARICS